MSSHQQMIESLVASLKTLMSECGNEPQDTDESRQLWKALENNIELAERHALAERPNFVLDCAEPHVAADSLEAINVECTVNEETGQVHVIVPEDDEDFKELIGLLQEQNFDMDVFHNSI